MAYTSALWEGHRLQNTFMQALQLGASVGGAVAPYMISPFLVDIPVSHGPGQTTNITGNSILTSVDTADANDLAKYDYYSGYSNTSNMGLDNSTNTVEDIELVKYAYVLIGLLFLACGLVFAFLFCANGVTCSKIEAIPSKAKDNTSDASQSTPASRSFILFVLICLFFFYIFYVFAENVPSAFVSIFSVKYLGLDVQYGALIVTVFWTSLTVSRILNIPLSFCIGPTVIVGLHSLLVVAAYLVLLLFVDYGNSVLIGCIIAAAVGLGPVFASQMVWASKVIPFTGATASLCTTAWAVGKISVFSLSGLVIEKYGEIWMIYLALLGACMVLLLFLLMLMVSKMCNGQGLRKKNKEESERTSLNKC